MREDRGPIVKQASVCVASREVDDEERRVANDRMASLTWGEPPSENIAKHTSMRRPVRTPPQYI